VGPLEVVLERGGIEDGGLVAVVAVVAVEQAFTITARQATNKLMNKNVPVLFFFIF
jgi:hypothetical protein